MPRESDQVFLKVAVKQRVLAPRDAEEVYAELTQLEAQGKASKARHLCVELGFMDKGLARRIKHEVRRYLDKTERRAQDESRSQRRLAGFELLERMGSGAMGTVYKALHLGLNKVVALKLLNPTFAGDEKYVARFLQEARSADRLRHPNIVQAWDVGRSGDVYYMAMEFVDGKTVKELIQRRGRLEEAAAIEITIQVVEALEHAHKNSIIHRDVKPANVMITRDGRAKLLDLGLARRTDVENGLTGEGKAIGTPYFMAPEAALDKGTDYRADFYSMGVTLFNMVTGEKPYEGSTPVAVMNMHLKAPIPDPRSIEPDVSEALSRVIRKMIAKRPADRYQDHRALIADLEAALAGAAPALKGGKAPEGVDFIKPRGPSPSRPPRSKSAKVPSAAAPGRSRRPLLVGALAASLAIGGGLLALGSRDEPASPGEMTAAIEQEEVDATAVRERAARAQLDVIADGANQGRARADDLLEVAGRFPGTQAGQAAQEEAKRLLSELEGAAQGRYDSRSRELDALARSGRLRDAQRGYEELGRSLEDPTLAERAAERADDLRGEVQRRLAAIQDEVLELVRASREEEAAARLRASLALLSADEHDQVLGRASLLEAKARERRLELARKEEARAAERAKQEAEVLSLLPAQLRERVKADRVDEALALAREQLAGLDTPAFEERARVHISALEAVVALRPLALASFEDLVGQEVSLERRQGRPIKGTLRAADDGELVVTLSERAEVTVDAADLAEAELLRAIRRARSATHPGYLRGVAALKLYRGDEDAAAWTARAAEEGIDLSALADELRSQPVEEEVEIRALHAAHDGAAEPEASPASAAAPARAADDDAARIERERRLAEALPRLFPDAAQRGFMEGRPELLYSFQENQSFARDWRHVSGRSYPAPAGQQRNGLVLEGRNGRAEFVAPVEGDFSVTIRFESQMIGSQGRLAITLDDAESRRYSNELGALLHLVRGRPKAQAGESRRAQIRAQQLHLLELVRQGDDLITKFDNREVARMPVDPELGPVRLGLEWGRAALNLLTVEVAARPAEDWLAEQLP